MTNMIVQFAHMPDRAVLHVAGEDALLFLDGLATCDMKKDMPRFGALLSPQGKILFDFIITGAKEGGYYLDCAKSIVGGFIKRLGFYKLRAKVEIADVSDSYSVVAGWGGIIPANTVPDGSFLYTDPRLADLGQRMIIQNKQISEMKCNVNTDDYHNHRIGLGVPEAGYDFNFGEAFPHEVLMDQLNGVDFKKGCYVGQEVVSRMQHRGTARTRMMQVELSQSFSDLPAPVVAGEKTMGELRSLSGTSGLALLRLDRVSDALVAGLPLSVNNNSIHIKKPSYATFDFPIISPK